MTPSRTGSPRRVVRLWGTLSLVALTTMLSACGGERPVVVGSKNFTEQVILGELIAQLVEVEGIPVDRRFNLGGSFICHNALVNGSLDVYVEYSGTALNAILKEPVQHDPQAVYDRVKQVYRDEFGLEWATPLGFSNTYAMAMRAEQAAELGIERFSDLADHLDTIRPGAGHEFLEREDGLPGLLTAYDLNFAYAPRGMELGLIYQALVEGEVDLVAGNSTDGLIEKFGLKVLEDDRRFFPPYDAAPVYRPDAIERHPGLASVLERLAGAIDEPTMRRLNRWVDNEGRSAAEVVSEFIEERGWVASPK